MVKSWLNTRTRNIEERLEGFAKAGGNASVANARDEKSPNDLWRKKIKEQSTARIKNPFADHSSGNKYARRVGGGYGGETIML